MFHVMLVLPVLLILAFIIAAILTGIFIIVLSAVGGTSFALLIKNKNIRKLIFIGASILALVGLACLLPVITMFGELSSSFLFFAIMGSVICIGILSIVGMRFSRSIQNKIGKTVSTILFILTLVAAISVAIAIPVIRVLFTS